MVHVQSLSVWRGGKRIVNQASLSILPGEIRVLMGANGAGKSTLLHAIAGGYAHSSGHIWWDGQPLKDISQSHLAQKRAVMAQQVQLNFPMKVHDLVEMGSYVRGTSISPGEKDHMILKVLEEVDMLSFRNRIFTSLSGGEQKRVVLAKCLLQIFCNKHEGGSQYLLMDEPSAGLDIHQQYKFIALIRRLVSKHQIGVLTILHDLNLASIFADHIYFIKSGEITSSGTPDQVLQETTLQSTFGIRSIIHPHPVYGCPQITALPL